MLLLGPNDAGRPDGLPSNARGVALIGDPRNGVHRFVSQLHVAMPKVHHRLVDRPRNEGFPERGAFEAAGKAARWHDQAVALHARLPRLTGRSERGPCCATTRRAGAATGVVRG